MHTRVAPRLPIVRFVEERSRTQRRLAALVVAVAVLWLALRALARTLLDRWWLQTVTDAPVWSRRTAAQVQLGIAAGAIVLIVLGGTVWVVLRHGREDHGRRHRMVERYHERVGPAHRWVLIGLVAVLTWRIGRTAGGEWQSWLLFRHGGDIGVDAPEIGGDLGFYLFRLPFLQTASSFLRQLVLVSLAVALFGHAVSGALRFPRREQRTTPVAVTHLSVLGALLLALQATHDVVVDRSLTATNRVGAFDGPGYTAVNVTRPALLVVALITIAAGFAVVAAGRSRRWKLATAALVTAVIAHVGGLGILPRLVEAYVVAPAEAERQLWSIEHNLTATRAAYGLDRVEVDARRLVDGATAAEPDRAGVPLFSTESLRSALQVLSGTAGTRVRNVDLVRYEIDGVERPVYTAVRASSRADLPEQGWVQEHLVYTHGDGVIALAADVAAEDGRPDLTPLAELEEAANVPVYYGEGLDGWYVIAGTRRTEVGGATYDGAGVRIGSIGRRAVLALAVGEPQPLLSNELTGRSLLLYRRSLTERLSALAPFLTLDGDPYAVVDGDRVVWVVDAYTTASTYPYAQFLDPASVGRFGDANYVQASVVATVDAHDGTVHLYRTDAGDDPIIEAWASVFPDLLDPIDEMPPRVAAHVRYPEDLFTAQSAMLGRYHVTDAELLFSGADRWTVTPAPVTAVGEAAAGQAPAVDLFLTGESFDTTRTYGPGATNNPNSMRDELAGIAVAQHSIERRLRLIVPAGERLHSPQVAQSAIDADPRLAQDITLLNANGSKVVFGPLSPVLIGDGVVWARSIIVIGTSAGSAPRLYGVAVVSDGLVGLGPTVEDALATADQAADE